MLRNAAAPRADHHNDGVDPIRVDHRFSFARPGHAFERKHRNLIGGFAIWPSDSPKINDQR
jgi:hypothetical protein